MADAEVVVQDPQPDSFAMEVTFQLMRNGAPWTRSKTESFQMGQTDAVIGQHVVIGMVKDALFKLGAAAAAAKDPEFADKYAKIKALLA